MAQEGPPKPFQELSYRAKRGEPNTFPGEVRALTEQMRALAGDLAAIAQKYGFSKVHADVQKPNDLLGTIDLRREPATGELAVIIDDRRLEEEIQRMPEGVPYFAPEDAFFYHRPKPGAPDLVPNPDDIKVGQAPVWLWIDKTRQWGVPSQDAGVLTYRVEDGKHVEQGGLIFAVKPHEGAQQTQIDTHETTERS